MSSLEIPMHHHYGHLLATFQEKNGKRELTADGRPILNPVRDYNPSEVPENSIGIIQIGTFQCTAWVVAVPEQLTIANKQVLCFVITCGHSFIHPFAKDSFRHVVRFTFEQDDASIADDLRRDDYLQGYPIFCPTDVQAEDPEIDPISRQRFELPHDIALFAIMKAKKRNITANVFPFTFKNIAVEENSLQEANVIGYPKVTDYDIQPLILPGMEAYMMPPEQVTDAFQGKRSLVVSPGVILPKSGEDNYYAVTNPAAPRLSGAPLIINGEVCGILTGSLPLPNHFHAVKVALLAQTDLIGAIKYVNDNNLSKVFISFSVIAEKAEILFRRLQMREVEEANSGNNVDFYQEPDAGAIKNIDESFLGLSNKEALASTSKAPKVEMKEEEERIQEMNLFWETPAHAITKQNEKDSERVSDEKILNEYLEVLNLDAERIYNKAYQVYYSRNPDALRYNLCFASSSIYFKAVLLIAKLGEKTCEDFLTLNDFFCSIEKNSGIILARKRINSQKSSFIKLLILNNFFPKEAFDIPIPYNNT